MSRNDANILRYGFSVDILNISVVNGVHSGAVERNVSSLPDSEAVLKRNDSSVCARGGVNGLISEVNDSSCVVFI